MLRLCLFALLCLLTLGSALPAPSPDGPRLTYADLSCDGEEAGCAQILPGRPAAVAVPSRPLPGADVKVVVSLPEQRLWVFRAGALVASSAVSTGRRGHETPVGRFPILQKKVKHRSNKYSNAPMPYMQRLTAYGIALHGGHLPGYPASHGCIRLPHGFARTLYGLTGPGTKVTITRARPRTAAAAARLA